MIRQIKPVEERFFTNQSAGGSVHHLDRGSPAAGAGNHDLFPAQSESFPELSRGRFSFLSAGQESVEGGPPGALADALDTRLKQVFRRLGREGGREGPALGFLEGLAGDEPEFMESPGENRPVPFPAGRHQSLFQQGFELGHGLLGDRLEFCKALGLLSAAHPPVPGGYHEDEVPGLGQLDPVAQRREPRRLDLSVINEESAIFEAVYADGGAPPAAGSSGDGLEVSFKTEQARAGARDGHSKLRSRSESEMIRGAGGKLDVEVSRAAGRLSVPVDEFPEALLHSLRCSYSLGSLGEPSGHADAGSIDHHAGAGVEPAAGAHRVDESEVKPASSFDGHTTV